MIKRLDVFENLDKEYFGFLWCHKRDDSIYFLFLKDSPENIQLIYYATNKFWELIDV